MVNNYSTWAKSVSDQVLPLMEQILSQELIPQYQRAVVVAFPQIAQAAAQETAARNGTPNYRRGPMFGVLWRSDVVPVGGGAESSYSPDERTLPVVDVELDSLPNQDAYVQTAVAQRRKLSHDYLNQWNAELMSGFDQLGKMSQFSGLWRSFTCGYLEHLLNVEYPKTNLPMVIYEDPAATANPTATLAKNYTFVGVVYWKKLPESLPGLFHNPLEADDQAFAEVHLFIPRDRLEWVPEGGGGGGPAPFPLGRRAGPGRLAAHDADRRQRWRRRWGREVDRGAGGRPDRLEPFEPELGLSACARHTARLGRDPAIQSRSFRLRAVQAAEPRRAEQRRIATD